MWLPILHRELLVASRKPTIQWVRLVPGICAFVVVLLLIGFPGTEPGLFLFQFLSTFLFGYALLSGLIFTADCISSERRAGTLPILQITGLRPLDIVLGKLAANSLHALFGLVGVIPALTLPLLLGGVTAQQVLHVSLVVLGTLFLSVSMALFASSEANAQSEALKSAGILLLFASLLGPFVLFYYIDFNFQRRRRHSPRLKSVERTILAFFLGALFFFFWRRTLLGNPLPLFASALNQRGDLFTFWLSLAFLFGLSFVFLLMGATFEYLLEEEDLRLTHPADPVAAMGKKSKIWAHSDPLVRFLAPSDATVRLLLVLALVLAGFRLLSSFLSGLGWGLFRPFQLLSWLFSVPITLLVARQLASFFCNARENGWLETLLVTPISWEDIIAAHKRIYYRFVRWPFLILFGSTIIPFLIFLWSFERHGFWGFILFCSTILQWLFWMNCLFWVSLFFAQRRRTALHAAALTIVLVEVAPLLFSRILPIFVPFFFGGGIPYLYFLFQHFAFVLSYFLLARSAKRHFYHHLSSDKNIFGWSYAPLPKGHQSSRIFPTAAPVGR